MIQPKLLALAAIIVFECGCTSGEHQREWHNSVPILNEQPGQLELRIAGEHDNVIEVYFHNQGVDSDQFAVVDPPSGDTAPLEFGKTVIVSQSGPYGTFAVIYGNPREKLRALGWQVGKAQLARFELPATAGRPIRAEWATPKILRVECEKGKDPTDLRNTSSSLSQREMKPGRLSFRRTLR